ncbi:acyltransferase [Evansella tamaricis]|uniref:Acyltransferase n=1 Tax=Evansella tamaricis TaxID=2069301 RepID=A0ABS6JEV9_9BACI|nr:acyltransferase [Evansella tamaricis]MBU9711759.1 acyltransferase [Evansella tamaricis]
MNKNIYYNEISFIRAIACMLVLMVHITADYYYENGQTHDTISLFLNQLSRYGTPLFAVVSGFLLFNESLRGTYRLPKFFRTRLTKVVIPFLVWSLFYLAVISYFSLPSSLETHQIANFLYTFFSGYHHLYFIIVVVQFYLLFPLIQFIRSGSIFLLITGVSLIINILFLTYFSGRSTNLIIDFINNRSFLLAWIFYFMIGGVFAHYWIAITSSLKRYSKFSFIAITLLIFSAFIEYYFFGAYSSRRLANLVNIPLLFLSLSSLYYLTGNFKSFQNVMLRIGNLSMGIYLVHPFILYLFRKSDFVSGFYQSTFWLPLLYTTALFLSIIFIKLIQIIPLSQYIVTVPKPPKVTITPDIQMKKEA